MSRPQHQLRLLLRCVGVPCSLALVAVVMPTASMDAIHRWLGMGGFPEEPIAGYLARSTSALCGVYGLLLLTLSRDVTRFGPLITLQGIAIPILATGAMLMMWSTEMPLWWPATDAIGGCLFGASVLWLQKRIPAQALDEPS